MEERRLVAHSPGARETHGCMGERPNVVLIVSDTFRRDHLGAYGNPSIRTPALDRLAADSVVFDHHLVSSFPTMPARAGFITGRFAYSFLGWEPLPTGIETLPGILGTAGWLTMGVVDTPFFIREGYGYDRGFDDFIWVRGQGDDTRPAERSDARLTWVREADRLVARTMSAAEDWLERHHREPFFLYVDTWDPHEPWDAPDYYAALYKPDYDGRHIYPAYGKWREHGLTEEDLETVRATYRGEVTMVDRWLGRLLEKVDVLGLRENTYVFFTSDHGFYFGEHGYFGKAEWFHDPDAALAAGSDVPAWLPDSWLLTIGWSPLYQELTRVPLLARGPDFAEGELTSAVDSRTRRISSYMPLTVTTRERSLLLGGPSEAPELYHLDSDPGEERNVWQAHAGEGLEIAESAVAFLEELGTPERHLLPRRLALEALAAS